MSISAVIMAGGSGTRLWPLSRSSYPKQFLSLYGEDTLLQSTVKRLAGLDVASLITICNEDHRFLVAEQLRKIDKLGSIILEPTSRNTAPAIALAAFSVTNDPLLLVLCADHLIQNDAAFTKAVLTAIPLAESGKLVTFGVAPRDPKTGYGYIKRGEEDAGVYSVDKFIEKPSSEDALTYFQSGDYFWNSGMFLFRTSRYLEELKKYHPNIFDSCNLSMKNSTRDNNFLRVSEAEFNACESISVDYAIIEKTDDAVVVPIDAGWNDIGSWSSLWDISDKDENGNAKFGNVITHESHNSYIRTEGKLVAAIGLENLVIVSTRDALVVANKDSDQSLKAVVEKLIVDSRPEAEHHREIYRPWGKYDVIDIGERYQVKRITVNPGAKLSLQMHHHRAEHWVVVSGSAKVTNGENTFLLSENESTYIPIGVVHSLENPGKVPLEIIEIQSGSYLGEDDIIRFEDIYGRVNT